MYLRFDLALPMQYVLLNDSLKPMSPRGPGWGRGCRQWAHKEMQRLNEAYNLQEFQSLADHMAKASAA